MPANRRQSAEQRDGDLLAGDALGKALLPGVRVIPDAGAAAGHQALPAEAAATARSAPLPRATPTPLVNGPPEGETEERDKGGCWKAGGQRGDCFLPIFSSSLPPILPSCTDLSGPARGSAASLIAPSQASRGRETPWS